MMGISNLSACHAESKMPQALPPHVQGAREQEAILQDSRFIEWLGNAPILKICKIDGDAGPSYIFITDSAELQVDVHYLQSEQHICGPVKFELVFHPSRTSVT